jgi:dienelactone hydrolase
MLRLEGTGPDHLLFLPGFMAAATSYVTLLRPLAAAGLTVLIPQMYPRGIGALRGKVSIRSEAQAAADLVRGLSGRVFVGGHSRGGQAAWLAAGMASDTVAGVCLVDPVDGHARRPAGPSATLRTAGFSCPSLIIGAGVRGPCAPQGADHEQFARATPATAHIVIADLGHADMLNGRGRAFGRWLCGAGEDPDAAREVCSQLLVQFIGGQLPAVGDHPGFRRSR